MEGDGLVGTDLPEGQCEDFPIHLQCVTYVCVVCGGVVMVVGLAVWSDVPTMHPTEPLCVLPIRCSCKCDPHRVLSTCVLLLLRRVEEALAIANFVFTAAFSIEMILKLIGLGAWKYLSDPWSLFDAVVVAFSLVELVTELMARSSANGLTALRWVQW